MVVKSEDRQNGVAAPERGEVSIADRGQVRASLAGVTVRSVAAGQDDVVAPQPAEIDLARPSTQVLRLEGSWYRAEVVVERAGTGHVFARLSAQSWDSERWWDGGRYGLAGERTATLGLALPNFARGLACAMIDEWWTRPSFVDSPGGVPERTQFLLWQESDGSYGVLLPLVGGDGSAHLAGSGDTLELHLSTADEGRIEVHAPLFVLAFGGDPYRLIDEAYELALEKSGRHGKRRVQKTYPECLEYLGWCTWDAFYREVTADKVIEQLEHFGQLGLPVKFLLIDDGWYPKEREMLVDTRTDLAKFPGGLGKLFERARREHAVRYVGLWHAMTGYWSGIHPRHTLDTSEQQNVLETRGRLAPALERGRAFAFYDDWHSRMKSDGCDFVKVDGQGAIHRYSRNLVPIARAARDAQTALQASVGVHFQGQMINCMSMAQELAWFWAMSNVTRSSTDYMIHGTESSSAEHARSNVYNSLWLGQLSWCDWDMFRTDQATAGFHAALRAVSGGPVYVSDGLRVTRPEIVRPLVARDGRVLRCDQVGVPTADCLFVDPLQSGRPLKVMNACRHTGVVGVFNLSHAERQEAVVHAGDAGRPGSPEVVIWSHARRSGQRLARHESMPVTLAPLCADVLTVAPLDDGFAVVGIVDKMIPAALVERTARRPGTAVVSLSEGGSFCAYSDVRPSAIKADGAALPFVHEAGWLRVQLDHEGPLVLSVEW